MVQAMRERSDGVDLQRLGAIEYSRQYLISPAATNSGSEVRTFLSFSLHSSFAAGEV